MNKYRSLGYGLIQFSCRICGRSVDRNKRLESAPDICLSCYAKEQLQEYEGLENIPISSHWRKDVV